MNRGRTVFILGNVNGRFKPEIYEEFLYWERQLLNSGYCPVNPVRLKYYSERNKRICEWVKEIADADAVFLYEGIFYSSEEVKLLFDIAMLLNKPVVSRATLKQSGLARIARKIGIRNGRKQLIIRREEIYPEEGQKEQEASVGTQTFRR